MRNGLITFIIFLILLLASCGAPIAGTGQQGEARIVGIAMSSAGIAASGQPIVVTTESAARAIAADTVWSDQNGRFVILKPAGTTVTISSRIDDRFLYIPSITVSSGEQDLGTRTFAPGRSITIYPWWENSDDSAEIALPGTVWNYRLSGNRIDTIVVPQEMAELIVRTGGSENRVELGGESTGSIGDPSRWNDSAITFVKIPEMTVVGETVTLSLIEPYNSGDYYATVFWGETEIIMTTDPIHASYRYLKAGPYAVEIALYKIKGETPILKERRKITVIERNDDTTTVVDGDSTVTNRLKQVFDPVWMNRIE